MAAAVAAMAMAAAAERRGACLLGGAELPGGCGSNGGSSGERERCWCACVLLLAAAWALQGHSISGVPGPGSVTAAGVPLVGAVTALHETPKPSRIKRSLIKGNKGPKSRVINGHQTKNQQVLFNLLTVNHSFQYFLRGSHAHKNQQP